MFQKNHSYKVIVTRRISWLTNRINIVMEKLFSEAMEKAWLPPPRPSSDQIPPAVLVIWLWDKSMSVIHAFQHPTHLNTHKVPIIIRISSSNGVMEIDLGHWSWKYWQTRKLIIGEIEISYSSEFCIPVSEIFALVSELLEIDSTCASTPSISCPCFSCQLVQFSYFRSFWLTKEVIPQ